MMSFAPASLVAGTAGFLPSAGADAWLLAGDGAIATGPKHGSVP